MKHAVLKTLTSACVFAPAAVLAHTGHGDTGGLIHGFAHPISGVDHVLAMVAVGMIAAQLGGRALWLLPLSFVGVMTVGGIFGMAGVALPFSEIAIAVSVIVLGLAVAFPPKLPVGGCTALVGLFGLFHGYVHGGEMPSGASGFAYAVGFLSATGLLIGFGIVFGLLVFLPRAELGRRVVQAGGGAIAVCGIAMLTALI